MNRVLVSALVVASFLGCLNVFAGSSTKSRILITRTYYSSELSTVSESIEHELVREAESRCGSIQNIESLENIKFSIIPSAPLRNTEIVESRLKLYKMLLTYPEVRASANLICKE